MKSAQVQPKKSKLGTRPTGFQVGSAQSKRSSRDGSTDPGKPNAAIQAAAQNQTSNVTAARPTAAPTTTPRNAPPMKKRAKGSGFLGLIFLSAFIALGYTAWSSLLQYQAFGLIEGRVISVASPWDGSVAAWEVRDGEVVKQGQVLAQIKNLDMEHELATLGDELKMNQALLEAEMSKIRFETHSLDEQNQVAQADYHKALAELVTAREDFKELQRKLDRAKRLFKSNTVSRSAYEEIFFKYEGQKKRIAQLNDAARVLKERSRHNIAQPDGSTRLKPLLSQIDLTKFQIDRLREKVEQGKIKSPVTGRVSKRHRLTGESAKANEVVIEILEDNSIEAVLYLPQKVVDEYEVGKVVEVSIEPYRHSLQCRVDRFGDQFETAPPTIERFYQVNQPLLPVYLTPLHDTSDMLAARVGGTVKRPYDYSQSVTRLWEDGRVFVSRILGQPKPLAPKQNNAYDPTAKINADNVPFKGETHLAGFETKSDLTAESPTIEKQAVAEQGMPSLTERPALDLLSPVATEVEQGHDWESTIEKDYGEEEDVRPVLDWEETFTIKTKNETETSSDIQTNDEQSNSYNQGPNLTGPESFQSNTLPQMEEPKSAAPKTLEPRLESKREEAAPSVIPPFPPQLLPSYNKKTWE